MKLRQIQSRFRVLETLGQGGSGVVYRAWDSLRDREVALKVVSGGQAAAAGAEFQLLASHSHPHIVRVFDYGRVAPERPTAQGATSTDPGSSYFSMELVAGSDLLSFARGELDRGVGKVTPGLCRVIAQLLEALEYLHVRGILHLDIKPSNVLVAQEGADAPLAKLLDFGLARRGERAESELTGTVEYLAPERLRGQAADARADLYAVGVVLYEIFHGHCPMRGDSAAAVVQAHLQAKPSGVDELPAPFDSLVARLLEKDPARRPASARAVIAEFFSDVAAPDALPSFGAALVGREALLEEFRRKVREATEGRSSATLLRGGVGAGKSRLLREVQVQSELAGLAADLDACREVVGRPGELLERWLRRLSRHGAPAKERDAAGLAAELARLGQDEETRVQGSAALEVSAFQDAERARESLLFRFAQCVLDATSREPRVLLVDDIQRADSLSRAGLLALLRALEHRGRGRLVLVLAARTGGEEADDGLGEFEETASELKSLDTLLLPGLDEGAVSLYMEQVLGVGSVPDGLVGELVSSTGGNVYFIEEYVKLLVQSGDLRRRGKRWELRAARSTGDASAVPASVEDVLRRRLDGLPEMSREVLRWISVLDRPVCPEELGVLIEDLTPVVAETVLEELAREQLLQRERSAYFLQHAGLRAVAYRSIPAEEQRRRHGAIAEMLENSRDGQRAQPSSWVSGSVDLTDELAHHLFLSPAPRRARPYLARAGERARRRGALREALRHLSRALEIAESSEERFRLLLSRHAVLGLLGQQAVQERDLSELDELAVSMRGGAWRREAILCRAIYLESIGRQRDALPLLDEALALAAEQPADAHRILTRAGMLRMSLGEVDTGLEAFEEALRWAREHNDVELEAESLQFLGLARYRKGDHDDAVRALTESLVLLSQRGAEHRLGALQSNLGLVHLENGDFEAAQEHFDASLKIFRRVGLRRGEAVNLTNLGLTYLEMGRIEPALTAISEALELRRELGDRRGEGSAMGNLGAAWMCLGRWERALPLLEGAVERARELDNKQSESANESRLGDFEVERGRFEKALGHFQRGLELAEAASFVPQLILAHEGLARAYLARTRVTADAEAELRRASEHAGVALRHAEEGGLGFPTIALRSLLAIVVLRQGDFVRAERLSAEAVEALTATRGWLAAAHRIWYERFQVLEACRRAHGSTDAGGGSLPDPTEGECEDALRRAYALLRQKCDAFEDPDFGHSYLESVAVHAEINRLHRDLQSRTRKEATRRERSFHEIARSIHSILELDPLLDRLLELAIETTHAEKGLVLLKDVLGNFTIRAARGMARETVEDATDICRSVIEDVARGGGPILATDAGSDERFRDRRSIISFHIRTLMCVPLAVRDEIIGAVYVDGRGAFSFQQDDLHYLVSFAQLAGTAVENARMLDALRAENLDLRREVESRYRFENLVAESEAMTPVLHLMEKVAHTSVNVVLNGETGTGKEVVARAIHYASDRRSHAFVAVDCGALPESLLESELFGHRRGAFSGAIHNRVGLFEAADGGTLFLDEITNTSLDLQAKLLRALQEGEIRRVGENETRKVDVRVIAASNVDVRQAVEDQKFREDLFYRLNVVPIDVPPLRERRGDVPLLASHFLAKSCARHGREEAISGFEADALRLLESLPWRGNVRELENFIEKAVILAEDRRLSARYLRQILTPGTIVAPGDFPEAPLPREEVPWEPADEPPAVSLEEFDARWLRAEARYLRALVSEAGGNLAEAARRARVRNRNTLISRLRKHGINRETPGGASRPNGPAAE